MVTQYLCRSEVYEVTALNEMLTDNQNSKHKRHFVVRCHCVQGSRHSEATCTPVSQSQMSIQPSNTTYGQISPRDAATPL
jgi:hypothetical protein